MVTVQIVSAKGKQLKLVKSLPASLEFPGKETKDVKIGDVKAKLAEKHPKVRSFTRLCIFLLRFEWRLIRYGLVLCFKTETLE